jgi:hypothetical protein
MILFRNSELNFIKIVLYAWITLWSTKSSFSFAWSFDRSFLFKLCSRKRASRIRWYFFDLCRIFKFENWLRNCETRIKRRFILMTKFVLMIEIWLQMSTMTTWSVWMITDFFRWLNQMSKFLDNSDQARCFEFCRSIVSFCSREQSA